MIDDYREHPLYDCLEEAEKKEDESGKNHYWLSRCRLLEAVRKNFGDFLKDEIPCSESKFKELLDEEYDYIDRYTFYIDRVGISSDPTNIANFARSIYPICIL